MLAERLADSRCKPCYLEISIQILYLASGVLQWESIASGKFWASYRVDWNISTLGNIYVKASNVHSYLTQCYQSVIDAHSTHNAHVIHGSQTWYNIYVLCKVCVNIFLEHFSILCSAGDAVSGRWKVAIAKARRHVWASAWRLLLCAWQIRWFHELGRHQGEIVGVVALRLCMEKEQKSNVFPCLYSINLDCTLHLKRSKVKVQIGPILHS